MQSRDSHASTGTVVSTGTVAAESDVLPPPKAAKPVDPHVALIAELVALVEALAGQTPNAHVLQARVAALRARIDAL